MSGAAVVERTGYTACPDVGMAHENKGFGDGAEGPSVKFASSAVGGRRRRRDREECLEEGRKSSLKSGRGRG